MSQRPKIFLSESKLKLIFSKFLSANTLFTYFLPYIRIEDKGVYRIKIAAYVSGILAALGITLLLKNFDKIY